MAKDISLRQLRYFTAAAETGQLSMAAAKLFVSQSAITNAILLLEDRLCVKLFARHPHGVSLTAEGHSFHQHARHTLDSLRDALREPRFRANFPDVELDLHDPARRDVETGVASGELELGVVILSNVETPERFGHHVLMRSRRQLWAATGHPVLSTPYPSLEDISVHPYILLTVDEGEESNRRYWVDRGIEPDIAFRTNGMEALRGLVAHGFGVTILSDMAYRPWSLEGEKIEARPILDGVPYLEVGMLWKPNARLAAPAKL